MSTLPAEIISRIFSFLQSEPAAITACLESHPLLLEIALPYAYSNIFLKTGDSSVVGYKPADLTRILSKRPHIAHYIRSLDIIVGGKLDAEIQRHRLEEISTILPNLSALKKITLDHALCPSFGWEGLPESFRLAFLDCLRMQSMRDLCIDSVLHFPYTSAQCKSITVRGCFRVYPSTSTNNLDLDLEDGPSTNQDFIPFESLCLQDCTDTFLQGFVPWFVARRSQLRSLEFEGFCGDDGHYCLPMLLSNSSNTLTSLDLHLGSGATRMSLFLASCIFLPFPGYYNFNMPPNDDGATKKIPVTLSTLPHLEQLTIHATLHYDDHKCIGTSNMWGFHSPIPSIAQLFSSPHTPSFKCLNLDFNFDIRGQSLVQSQSLPWSLLSDVICTPLIHLLSTISAFECSVSSSSIRVDLRLRGASTTHRPLTILGSMHRTIPLNVIHFLLAGSKELMRFVEQGRLIVTPPVPTSLDLNVIDSW